MLLVPLKEMVYKASEAGTSIWLWQRCTKISPGRLCTFFVELHSPPQDVWKGGTGGQEEWEEAMDMTREDSDITLAAMHM